MPQMKTVKNMLYHSDKPAFGNMKLCLIDFIELEHAVQGLFIVCKVNTSE